MTEAKSKEDLEIEVVHLHDDLRTALQMLMEAHSPYPKATEGDKDWLEIRDDFLAAMDHDHFGGPEPKGEAISF